MPEKPKRRKNNKNKRKNKNNRSDPVKNNNSDVQESEAVETCCSDLQDDSHLSEPKNNLGNDVTLSSISLNEVKVDIVTESNQGQSSQQDLNNNSANVEIITIPVSNQEESISQISETYIVESPEQSLKSKVKLNHQLKSKSLDNGDEPIIEEITEDTCDQLEDDTTMAIIDSNVLVSDVESDVEWQHIQEDCGGTQPKEIGTGTLSITTMPLNVAQCEQTKSLTPEEEMSLRHYLQTLNLSTNPSVNAIEIKTEIEEIINREIRHRLRKKGLADDFISSRLAPPRMLDVIDEESGESSLTSRRQSYLSDKKSDNEDLEDDVFEDKPKPISHTSKPPLTFRPKTFGRLVPQECVLVGAKIKEPEVAEARVSWTMQTVEKMKGAEVVYLTDSSSSTSSIHEIGEDVEQDEDEDDSVRMITPTIEVTDTDHLLKKTFLSDAKEELQSISGQIENLTKKAHEILVDDCKKTFTHLDDNDVNTTNAHEIVVSSIDDIKTNLYVKNIDTDPQEIDLNDSTRSTNANIFELPKTDDYNLEIKVLKCQLNDAMNNLIKEVCSDSENNEDSKDTFIRQDSSSSLGSSQCTAKYNPTYSSLNDVSNFVHNETNETCEVPNTVSSHVKDVFECVAGSTKQDKSTFDIITEKPLTLQDLCVRKIVTLPYGDKILEELASVSERIQNIHSQNLRVQKSGSNNESFTSEKMPFYPLPDVSTIDKIKLPFKNEEPQPPPVKPRKSSLKKSHDENHWTGVPTKSEPVYVCLSPSQKMLMEKTNTIITKEGASDLVEMHKKFVDRRGYNEPSLKNKISQSEDMDPIVPFKSQTGSRLLALIRDPTVTSNINSTVNNRHYSLEQLKRESETEFPFRFKDDKSKPRDITSTFKPIPPPRPKKYSSSYYESDESSDFTDTSLRSVKSEKKMFHYSTGNLSKDIENDISSIQNMHRYYTNIRDNISDFNYPRRPSLPKDICDQQMEYIRQKEKEVEAEIQRLEQEKFNVSSSQQKGPRAPLIKEKEVITNNVHKSKNVFVTSKNDETSQLIEKRSNNKLSSLFSSSQEELLRDKMYTEYVSQMAERQERKQHKIIKITSPSTSSTTVSKSMSALDTLDSKVNNRIEKEFISKAKERWNKLGIADPETEDERERHVYREPKVIEHKIKVIEGGEERDMQKLPTHLREFVNFTAKQKEQGASSSGESRSGSASPHVQIWCAVIILILAVVKYFLRLLRNL